MFHSIQIKKTENYQPLRVCWMFLKDAVVPSCSCQSQACVGGLFVWLQELSGTEASQAPRFYVWAYMFLSNETPSTLLPADRRRCFRFASLSRQEKKRLFMVGKEELNATGAFKHSRLMIDDMMRYLRVGEKPREHVCCIFFSIRHWQVFKTIFNSF